MMGTVAGHKGFRSDKAKPQIPFDPVDRAMAWANMATPKPLPRLSHPLGQSAGFQQPTVACILRSVGDFHHDLFLTGSGTGRKGARPRVAVPYPPIAQRPGINRLQSGQRPAWSRLSTTVNPRRRIRTAPHP